MPIKMMQSMQVQSFRHVISVLVAVLCIASDAAAVVVAREITPQEAIAQVQREIDEKVLSVQTLNVGKGKSKIYRIKLLTRDGQMRIVQVPAEQ
ncbi:MAG: hypothetical protein LBQ20_01635 [Rhodanobacter sp.]|nr:hypothetical protein [Rhodanobacter sp.]